MMPKWFWILFPIACIGCEDAAEKERRMHPEKKELRVTREQLSEDVLKHLKAADEHGARVQELTRQRKEAEWLRAHPGATEMPCYHCKGAGRLGNVKCGICEGAGMLPITSRDK